VVFVTHDIDEALLLSDRIFFMEPKRIHQEITVNLPRPRSKESLYDNDEYRHVRNQLVGMFYHKVTETIGGEEVVL
jgi:NitT/TauT family transport system ATP-binding protein